MKKKNKNRARKSITAVGAVVAAGLTPGIATSTPVPQSPSTGTELTAADAVSINGEVLDFDELFAMNQVNRGQNRPKLVYGPPQPKVYGPIPPQKDKDKKKKDREQELREQQIADSLMIEQMKLEEEMRAREAAREKAIRDSIQRAIEEKTKVVYGPPPAKYFSLDPERVRHDFINFSNDEAIAFVEDKLMEYLSVATNQYLNSNDRDRDFIQSLNLTPQELTMLTDEVERSFGVQVSEDMLKQLNTPSRLVQFIVAVIKPTKQ